MKPFFHGFIAIIVTTIPAVAEDVCMPSEALQSALIDWYGETPTGESTPTGAMIWASSETGSFTFVEMRGDGVACVVGQGVAPVQSDVPDGLSVELEERAG